MEIFSVLQNSIAQVLCNYIRASFFYNEREKYILQSQSIIKTKAIK